LPKAKPDIQTLAQSLLGQSRAGDAAQALMDLGATICTPKKPACVLCPLTEDCAARQRGDQESFPRKLPKKAGALRRGAAFVVTRGGQLLVRTRPEKGLLGGMTEVPTSEWLTAQKDEAARYRAPRLDGLSRWRRRIGVVRHVFTHFPLELVVYVASVPPRTRAPYGMRWTPIATLQEEALPNLMRKVIAHGLGDRSFCC
jgi:A/G-specific adenine glycosylase